MREFDERRNRYPATNFVTPNPMVDDNDTIEPLSDDDDEDDDSATATGGPKKRELKADQYYVHLGLKKALLAQSCGVLYRDKYLRTLQLINMKDPKALTKKFKNQVFKKEILAEEVSCSISSLTVFLSNLLVRHNIFFVDFPGKKTL